MIIASLFAASLVAQVVPVQVNPGATASLARMKISATGVDSFSVTAKAGQTLLVELNVSDEEKNDPMDVIRVFAAGSTQSLPTSLGEDLYAHWMGTLAKGGGYRMEISRASKRAYDLRITLMEPNDPRIDPGIAAGRVSVSLGTIGKKSGFSLKRYSPAVKGYPDEFWPAHLSIEDKDFELRIMSLEGLKKTHWMDGAWLKGLAALEAALKPGVKAAAAKMLAPGSPNADLTLGACEEILEGKTFRAERFLGSYSQGDDPPSSPMTYVLQGISADGRYFVWMRAQVANPLIAEERKAKQPAGTLRARVSRRLAAAAPESFKPNLADLDGIFRSLQFQ